MSEGLVTTAESDRLEEDENAWVGVLTHNGPVFSAGADLKAINAGTPP